MTPNVSSHVAELLEPVIRTLPPDAAQRLAELQAPAATEDRVAILAAKANEGLLTPAERAEYESIIDASDLVATLQAIARRTLSDEAATS